MAFVPSPREHDDANFLARQHFGLRLPDSLSCHHCSRQLIQHICWDSEIEKLCCLRCASILHRLDQDRLLTVTIDGRGRVDGMKFIPASQAIALLIRFGAAVD